MHSKMQITYFYYNFIYVGKNTSGCYMASFRLRIWYIEHLSGLGAPTNSNVLGPHVGESGCKLENCCAASSL